MRRRFVLSSLLIFAAAGCESERALYVSLPPLEGARSMVAALKTDTALVVAASELDMSTNPPRINLPITELGAGQIYALLYAEPLAELGLTRGEVAGAAEGEPGYPLFPPQAIYQASYLGGAADLWTKSSTIDPALAEFRVRGTPPVGRNCFDFRELRFSVPVRADATFALAVTATVALVGFQGGAMFYVDRSGARSAGMLGSAPHHSAHLVSSEEIWIAGVDGRVVRRSPRLELPRAPSGDRIEWLSGSARGEPLELYAVGRKGAFEVWRDNTWTTLVPASVSEDWRRGVAAIAPGEAIAAGVGSGLVRVRDGVVSEQRVEGSTVMMAAAEVEGIGAVAGSIDGEVFVEEAGLWRTLADSPLALPVTRVVSFAGGFLAAGGGGYVVQYDREDGYCTEVQTGHPIIKQVAVLADAVVIAGDRASGTTLDSFVSVLEYQRF